MSESEAMARTTGESSDETAAPEISANNTTTPSPENQLRIPIVGYEVMEERAKFTVFKLRVESTDTDCWFVFRRYTDFVRLHNKLKADYPALVIPLPKKKWFGSNFDSTFLNERIEGLQELVNEILRNKHLLTDSSVRDFFCLDEPPSVEDYVEESKAVVEVLEERVFQLQRQLKEKEVAYERLKAAHSVEIAAKLRLAEFVQECTRQCPSCSTRLVEFTPSAAVADK